MMEKAWIDAARPVGGTATGDRTFVCLVGERKEKGLQPCRDALQGKRAACHMLNATLAIYARLHTLTSFSKGGRYD